jgi:SAM-dependent methyltransferase
MLVATFDFEDFAGRHHVEYAAAFCRGRLGLPANTEDERAVVAGVTAGLRLHKFKQSAELPRVRAVLGVLKGIGPSEVLDIGSGRGVFLWPLLAAFADLPVTAVDTAPGRVADLHAVTSGGVGRLRAHLADASRLPFAPRAFDVVTALEVVEHIQDVERAAREILRVARRFVVVSVPSKPDDNPEHVRLFDPASMTDLLERHGATNVHIDHVLNHMIAVAGVARGP